MSQTLIAQTDSGPVRGVLRQGTSGTQFYSYKGIPYAKAPIGELRFKVEHYLLCIRNIIP